jgi:uncharacterized glyoxalase superfamily protein PhnB
MPDSDRLQHIFPGLRYKDAPAAIEWLGEAFGFERRQVVDGPDGTLAHAELQLGPGMIMLSSDKEDVFGSRIGQGWVYVVIDDPDGHYARAKAAGAEIVMELTDTDYGSRDYSARDPEGNIWSFGTYLPGRDG